MNNKMLLIFMIWNVVSVSGFDVFWNVPSQQCLKNFGIDLTHMLSSYGIRVNDGDKFKGGNITIFYEAQLGLYPHFSVSGEAVNGGIPQRGDLSKHLKKAQIDLKETIPNKHFDGLGVIDWESWRPTWRFNWGNLTIYQVKSNEYAKQMDPSLSEPILTHTAKTQWESSAKSYMLESILLMKYLRPKAMWCYYLFPDCYNYNGTKPEDFVCSSAVQKENNNLDWLWKTSTAICPSIYLYSSYLDKYSFEQRSWRDRGKLQEAVRVASATAKLFPYINYFLEKEFVPKEDFERMAAQTAAEGGDGYVIWGPSSSVSSESQCLNLKNFIVSTIGPISESVAWKSDLCSKKICNSRGRCTWPSDTSAWKIFRVDSTEGFLPSEITCRCGENSFGRYCENYRKY